jgi:cation:H+ antiporter
MEILLPILLFIIGIGVIIKGGDILVDSAIWIAKVTGIPNIIIGATIVSLATTLPEFFVASVATLMGSPEIAMGNSIGAIICNTGLVLAIPMIVRPVVVDKKTFMPRAFMMIISMVLLLLFSTDGNINRMEGIALLFLLICYGIESIKSARKSLETSTEIASTIEETIKLRVNKKEFAKHISILIIGALLIWIGARLLVVNAQIIAGYYGIREGVISLTIMALITSIPELITVLTSISKNESGVAVGNVIGANILNITMNIAISGILAKGGLVLSSRNVYIFNTPFISFNQTILLDIPVALVMMLLLILPISTNGKYSKRNGIMLLSVYIIYICTVTLILK